MKKIEKESIDLVVTSPPYDNLRNYGSTEEFNFDKFKVIAKKIYELLKQNGVIVWVVADSSINGSESGNSFRQALYFKDIGCNIHDTMIYAKHNVVPLTHKRYEQSFEYMFVFSKGPVKIFNGIKDKINKYSGTKVHGTQYNKDATKRMTYHNKKTVSDFGLRHNIFYYSNPGNRKLGHPAPFPIQLAIDHIITWTNEKSCVLDPMMGSGTVGLACKKLSRDFIGIEMNKKYFDIANERINET